MRNANQPLSSSGACAMKRSQKRMTSGARSSSNSVGPAMTSRTGVPRNSNDVTTPKLPPPPRIAQNRSGCWSALVVMTEPSARTISAEIRLSIVRPDRRVR